MRMIKVKADAATKVTPSAQSAISAVPNALTKSYNDDFPPVKNKVFKYASGVRT
jgi:hypothetical protein